MLEDNLVELGGGWEGPRGVLYLKILEDLILSNLKKKQLINSIFRCNAFLKDIFSYKR